MASTSLSNRPRAVPFIYPSESDPTRLEIGAEAIQILSKLKATAIAPIAVCGRYRTGKSFLLNQLAGVGSYGSKSGGFEVGPTVSACTKGIWLWTDPILLPISNVSSISTIYTKGSGNGSRKKGGKGKVSTSDSTATTTTSSTSSSLSTDTIAVLFLDTEGLQSGTTSAEHDARIFSLAVLLSSLLIYNSVGAIDEDAISNLSFVAQLTRHIQVQKIDDEEDEDGQVSQQQEDSDYDSDASDSVSHSRQQKPLPSSSSKNRHAAVSKSTTTSTTSSTSSPSSLSAFFPRFLWVLRDFGLALVDENGLPLSPRDYLESCLAETEGYSTDTQTHNRIRRVLTTFFRERDAAVLVRPCNDEASLAVIDTLSADHLRPEFRVGVAELRERIFTTLIRPKVMTGGALVTGRAFAALAQEYVQALNAKGVPSIGNAWESVSKAECQAAFESALQIYRNGLGQDAHAATLPLDEHELQVIHEQHLQHALEIYEHRAVGSMMNILRKSLKTLVRTEFQTLLKSNAAASDAACSRIIAQIWQQKVEPRLLASISNSSQTVETSSSSNKSKNNIIRPYSSHDDFATDLTMVRQAYFDEAKGPVVHRVLSLFLLDNIPTILRAVTMSRSMHVTNQLTSTQALLAEVRGDYEAMKGTASVMEQQCNDLRIEKQTALIDSTRAQAEAKLAKEALQILESTLHTHEQRIESLQEALTKEKAAHANTRIQVRAGGILPFGGNSGERTTSTGITSTNQDGSIVSGAALLEAAAGIRSPSSVLSAAGGSSSRFVLPMDPAVQEAINGKYRLTLRPNNTSIATAPTAFPQPKESKCCTVQ